MALLPIEYNYLAQYLSLTSLSLFLNTETQCTEMVGEKEFIVNITIQCTLWWQWYISLIDNTVGYLHLENKICKNKWRLKVI